MFCISCLQLYLNSCFSEASLALFYALCYIIFCISCLQVYIYGCTSQFCFPVIFPLSFAPRNPTPYFVYLACRCLKLVFLSFVFLSNICFYFCIPDLTQCVIHLACNHSLNLACFICKLLFINKQYGLHHKDWISKSLVDDNNRKFTMMNMSRSHMTWKWVEELLTITKCIWIREECLPSHDMKVSWGVDFTICNTYQSNAYSCTFSLEGQSPNGGSPMQRPGN